MPAPFAPPAIAPMPVPVTVVVASRRGILAFAARTGHFAFRIRSFLSTAVGGSRRANQIHRVAIRENQGVQAHAKFAAAFNAARPLRIQQFSTNIGTDRNHHAIILRNRKRGAQVHRIARFGIARRNTVFQYHRHARPGRHFDSFRCPGWREQISVVAVRPTGGRRGGLWTVRLLREHCRRQRNRSGYQRRDQQISPSYFVLRICVFS